MAEDHFERYVRETQARGESITVAGLVRAARRYTAGPDQVRPGAGTTEAYWNRVWDAVSRVMDLDLCVSISAKKLGGAKFLQANKAIQRQLSGKRLVRTAKDVGPWLKKLAQRRQQGGIAEAMILFMPPGNRSSV